jgi:CBS domain-containing protein
MKTASDIMTETLFMIDASASVAAASEKMEISRTHSLLVERSGPTDAYGIITSTDVVRKVLAQGKDPAQVQVREVMTKPVITIPPDCTLFDIAKLMDSNHINHLPVYDGRGLVGMVSSTDIFNVKE